MIDDPVITHRGLLFTVAYEMLGSAADAEDVVQETWLRWAVVDQTQVRDPRAYLVRIVTRQALNRLRSVSRRREDYVGQWLPEPLLTSPDAAEDAELAEVVGKTPAAVRQIAHRAREHVAARRPRMQVDGAQQQATLEKFMAAISTGDMQGLVEVLAPDVVLIADGGGLVPAARKPITGVDRVAAYLVRLAELPDLETTTVWFNAMPGARVDVNGEATVVSLAVEDGRITRIYAMRNPQKMRWLEKEAELRR